MAVIIGITGTNGAGKGTIVNRLTKKYGLKHFSVRDYITKEIQKRALPVDRDSMILVGNALRIEHGEKFMEIMLRDVLASGENYIVESIRAPMELSFFKETANAYLFSVDAPQEDRYERAIVRGTVTDKISREKFAEQEAVEMQNTDPKKQNLSVCMNAVDPRFKFQNDGTPEELQEKVDRVTDELLQQAEH